MDFASYETLKFVRNDRRLDVILDGVGPFNGVNEQMHIELARVFHDLNNDLESDVIVLTGKDNAFCAGADNEVFWRIWWKTLAGSAAFCRMPGGLLTVFSNLKNR